MLGQVMEMENYESLTCCSVYTAIYNCIWGFSLCCISHFVAFIFQSAYKVSHCI